METVSGSPPGSEAPVSVKLEHCVKIESIDSQIQSQSETPIFSSFLSVTIKQEHVEEETQEDTNVEKSQENVENVIRKLMLEYETNGYTKWPKVVLSPLINPVNNIKQEKEDIIPPITIKQERYYAVNENEEVINPVDPLLEVSHEILYKGNSLGDINAEEDKSEVLKAIDHMGLDSQTTDEENSSKVTRKERRRKRKLNSNEENSLKATRKERRRKRQLSSDEEYSSNNTLDSDEEGSSKVTRKGQRGRPKKQKGRKIVKKEVLQKKKKASKITGRKWSYYSDTEIKEPDTDPFEDSGSDDWEPKVDEQYLAKVERALKKPQQDSNRYVWINLDEMYLD